MYSCRNGFLQASQAMQHVVLQATLRMDFWQQQSCNQHV
jgi:hypothetical protein